ncbi:methyltransferase domain-containing protein [Candidatus Gracilibacteria bacterium]|nr:methyltransferase domain-containing protein [Candidatus Gracilibacteria bacterium]
MNSEYDEFAEQFSHTRNHAWPEFDLLLPYLKKGDRVLDLGCGNGRLREFLDEGIIPEGNYFGLDISEKLLGIARGKFPKDHFFLKDFSKELPFGNDNFEIITAIASFHHLLSRKEQQNFLKECHRVTKKGGAIFLTTWKLPEKFFWPNVLKGRWKNWIIPFGSEKLPRTYRKVTDSELKKLLKKAGFKVVQAELFADRNYIALAKKEN